jgi:hypothetical protein
VANPFDDLPDTLERPQGYAMPPAIAHPYAAARQDAMRRYPFIGQFGDVQIVDVPAGSDNKGGMGEYYSGRESEGPYAGRPTISIGSKSKDLQGGAADSIIADMVHVAAERSPEFQALKNELRANLSPAELTLAKRRYENDYKGKFSGSNFDTFENFVNGFWLDGTVQHLLLPENSEIEGFRGANPDAGPTLDKIKALFEGVQLKKMAEGGAVANPFDDLIPQRGAAAGANPFDDLVPTDDAPAEVYTTPLQDAVNVPRGWLGGLIDLPAMTLEGWGAGLEAGSRSLARPIYGALEEVGLPETAESLRSASLPWYLDPAEILRRPGKQYGLLADAVGVPEGEETIASEIAGGLGQVTAQIAAARLTGGLGSPLSAGSMYGQGMKQQEEMIDQYAPGTDTAVQDAALIGGGVVTRLTEMYGLDKLLNRVPPQIKNRFMRNLANISVGGGIEGAQEVVEGLLQNLLGSTYSPDIKLTDGIVDNAVVGGGTGAIARAVLSAMIPGRVVGQGRAPKPDDEGPPDDGDGAAPAPEAGPIAPQAGPTPENMPPPDTRVGIKPHGDGDVFAVVVDGYSEDGRVIRVRDEQSNPHEFLTEDFAEMLVEAPPVLPGAAINATTVPQPTVAVPEPDPEAWLDSVNAADMGNEGPPEPAIPKGRPAPLIPDAPVATKPLTPTFRALDPATGNYREFGDEDSRDRFQLGNAALRLRRDAAELEALVATGKASPEDAARLGGIQAQIQMTDQSLGEVVGRQKAAAATATPIAPRPAPDALGELGDANAGVSATPEERAAFEAQRRADAQKGRMGRLGTFQTAKGSTYVVHEDGTTTRDKAARPEHPGARERGPQPRSEDTFYVTRDAAEKLSIIQALGGHKMGLVRRGNSVAVQYLEGPDAGKIVRDTVVPAERAPASGLLPVELWHGGRSAHFGNPITEVATATPRAPTRAPASPRERLLAYVIDTNKSLNPEAVAKHLGVTVDVANGLLSKLTAQENSPLEIGQTKNGSKIRRKARLKGPMNLFQDIAQLGGIPNVPELAQMDLPKMVGGGFGALVRPNGRAPALLAEDLQQRGYFGDATREGRKAGAKDLYNLIDEHARNKNVYSDNDVGEVLARDTAAAEERAQDEFEQRYGTGPDAQVRWNIDQMVNAGIMDSSEVVADASVEDMQDAIKDRLAMMDVNTIEEAKAAMNRDLGRVAEVAQEGAYDGDFGIGTTEAGDQAVERPAASVQESEAIPERAGEGEGSSVVPSATEQAQRPTGEDGEAGRLSPDEAAVDRVTPMRDAPEQMIDLSLDEIDQAAEKIKSRDFEDVVLALGSEQKAREYLSLDRRRNSSNPVSAEKASVEIAKIEDNLTPWQESLIFGTQEDKRLTPEGIDTIRDAAADVEFLSDAEKNKYDVARVFTWGMSAVKRGGIEAIKNGTADAETQAGFMRMRGAFNELKRRGLSKQEIDEVLIETLVARGVTDPNDAVFLLDEALAAFGGKRGATKPSSEQVAEPQQRLQAPPAATPRESERLSPDEGAAADTTSPADETGDDIGDLSDLPAPPRSGGPGTKLTSGIDPTDVLRMIRETTADIGKLLSKVSTLQIFSEARKTPKATPDQNPVMRLGSLNNLYRFSSSLASRFPKWARYSNLVMDRHAHESQLIRSAEPLLRPVLDMSKDRQTAINKILEWDRLTGNNRRRTSKRLVAVLRDEPTARKRDLSKPGETVELTEAETDAFFKVREFLDTRWVQRSESAARYFGYQGAWNLAAIDAALNDTKGSTDKGTIKAVETAKALWEMQEDARRRGYVPFMRYGDHVIRIKPKPVDVPGKDATPTSYEDGGVFFVETEKPMEKLLDRKYKGKRRAGREAGRTREEIPQGQVRLGGGAPRQTHRQAGHPGYREGLRCDQLEEPEAGREVLSGNHDGVLRRGPLRHL